MDRVRRHCDGCDCDREGSFLTDKDDAGPNEQQGKMDLIFNGDEAVAFNESIPCEAETKVFVPGSPGLRVR